MSCNYPNILTTSQSRVMSESRHSQYQISHKLPPDNVLDWTAWEATLSPGEEIDVKCFELSEDLISGLWTINPASKINVSLKLI